MNQKQSVEVDFRDSSLRWAVTKLIENINTLLDPIVLAVKPKPEWIEIWRDGKTIPDGYLFMGDDERRPAYVCASVIYNAEHQIGKITIEIIESNLTPYPPSLPLRKARIMRDALFTDDHGVVIQAARGHFVDHANYYCKRKNDEAQS